MEQMLIGHGDIVCRRSVERTRAAVVDHSLGARHQSIKRDRAFNGAVVRPLGNLRVKAIDLIGGEDAVAFGDAALACVVGITGIWCLIELLIVDNTGALFAAAH